MFDYNNFDIYIICRYVYAYIMYYHVHMYVYRMFVYVYTYTYVFISNFFFGQGPWTPWQMLAFGIIGFISGIVFKKRVLPKTKLSMCIYGFFATFVIYGGIMNPSSIIMWQNKK